jgi:hypothetical protein
MEPENSTICEAGAQYRLTLRFGRGLMNFDLPFLRIGDEVMLNSRIHVVTIACGVAAALLLTPALSVADMFGCQSCAAPVAVAPTYVGYAPQTYSYMPSVVYRAMYQPAVVTAYQPVYQPAAYNTYASYGVTTYRPLFGGWTYQARMVPYTTYQPVYTAAPVVAYSGCSSCASYSSCDSCSPCGGGSCGAATCGSPGSSCASCAAPPTVVTPSPDSGSNMAPPVAAPGPQRTFEEKKVETPSTETQLKPIPQTDTRLNSMPAPLLPDPRDRTAARMAYPMARAVLVASPIQTRPAQANDGWQPARN